MHSKLTDSDSQHPHSFFFEPIHEVAGDYHSPVVAVIGGGIAWDHSMRNLLPEGVRGIIAVVKNSCGQSYTVRCICSPLVHAPHADFVVV